MKNWKSVPLLDLIGGGGGWSFTATLDFVTLDEVELRLCNRNRLDSFNSASERTVGWGRGIKVAPWLHLQEPAEQKASLNKHRQRLLTSIEGGSESNRQGKGTQHNKSRKSSKLQMHANLSNYLWCESFFASLILPCFPNKQNRTTK